MAGPGHNGGPTMEGGYSYRLGLWRKARADLIPNTMPLEVIRMRVRRAEALGLDYKTYASVRTSTGRDVVGFLFSSNALRILNGQPEMPAARANRLQAVKSCDLSALVHRPLSPDTVLERNPVLHGAGQAPAFTDSWSDMRDQLVAALRARGCPADGVLIIGDTAFEREWMPAARAAGYLSADRYFAAG